MDEPDLKNLETMKLLWRCIWLYFIVFF
jgi:hypothetical protein